MLRVLLLQVAAHAGDRSARSRRGDEVRDLPFRLLPQLGARRRVVRVRVRLIVELVRENRVRRLLRDALRHHHVVVRMIRRDGGRRDDHFRTERLEQSHLFLRHLVGHREDALVALERRGDREPDTGVAARPFHDRSAGLELSFALRLLDDRHADAVLHRAAGIEELRLAVHRRANAARDAVEANERRPADRVENAVVRTTVAHHGASPRLFRIVSPGSACASG